LIQIARLIDLDKLEIISRHEITRAALEWSRLRNLDDNQRIRAARQFTAFAGRWLSFLGRLPAPPHESFEWMIRTFMSALSIRALKRATVVRHGAHVRTFFRYFPRDFEFRSTTLLDVDSFIKGKISAGWKAASVVSACYSLRSFFRFAGLQGWCSSGIYLGIKNPRVRRCLQKPMAPTWSQVLRLLKSFKDGNATQRRAKAMVMLCAIYGLRTKEVAELRLDDINWRSETFMVRRAKGGGVQHFPLHYEVGEAILAYLKNDRPQCSLRSVFVTRRAPYREFPKSALWRYVGPQLRQIGTRQDYVGPHCLRHACATRLLDKGASLKQIADFLGHRNLKSVDIYAHCDLRSLRKVAMHSLRGVL
jgi:site-specific recombinase XerD